MIAITDTSAFADVPIVQPQVRMIPSGEEIESLIGPGTIVNSAITSAFKALLKRISAGSVHPRFGMELQTKPFLIKVTQMFQTAGFYRDINNSGTIAFNLKSDMLDAATFYIINQLHKHDNFPDIAKDAFLGDSWAKVANDIRAMDGTELQKLHYITVNKIDINSTSQNIKNSSNILNLVEENNRILLISSIPEMPEIIIHNNSNVTVLLRIEVIFEKTGFVSGRETIYRKFIDNFPSEDTENHIRDGVYANKIGSDTSLNIDWLGKIRGGKVKIEYVPQPDKTSNIWKTGLVHSFNFHIRALNPTSDDVLGYLEEDRIQGNPNSSYLNKYWFIMKLVKHESGTHNRNEFEHFNRVRNNISYSYNNNLIGLPNFGAPRGFGLGQIDNFDRLRENQIEELELTDLLAEIQPIGPKAFQTIIDDTGRTIDKDRYIVASDEMVWNWKTNIDAIITIIESKISLLLGNLVINNKIVEYGIPSIRTFITNWNNSNPTNQVIFPVSQQEGNISYQAIRSSIVEFEPYNDIFPAVPESTDINKSFFDAMLLKTYNGIGSGSQRAHFLHLTPIPQSPSIKPVITVRNSVTYTLNGETRINYYVRDVSNENN